MASVFAVACRDTPRSELPRRDAGASSHAAAQPTAPLELGEMTSFELAAAIAAGRDAALLMFASVEQNGPHLTLDKHLVLGRAVALGIARAIPRIIVAPIVPFGRAPEHRDFAGTIDLSEPLYRALAGELVDNLARSGFRYVIVMTDHGTNADVLEPFVANATAAYAARGVRLAAALACYDRADARIEPELRDAGLISPASEHSSHAGLLDTSMLMALAPERVRVLPSTAGVTALSEADEQRIESQGIRAVSPSGVLGDPRRASVAIGERAMQLLVEECTRDVAEILGSAMRREPTQAAARRD